MAKAKKSPVMTAATKRIFQQIWKVMRVVLDAETWQHPFSDIALGEQIQARGCFCSKTMARDVRQWAGIPASKERRMSNFAKQNRGVKND